MIELTINFGFWKGINILQQAEVMQHLDSANIKYYPFPSKANGDFYIVINESDETKVKEVLSSITGLRIT